MEENIVLIVGEQSVLARGIENVLLNHTAQNWIVHRRSPKLTSKLFREIESIKPDVIILDTSMNNFNPKETLIRLMNRFSQIKIVVVGVNSNAVQIFNKDQVLVSSPADMLDLLKTREPHNLREANP